MKGALRVLFLSVGLDGAGAATALTGNHAVGYPLILGSLVLMLLGLYLADRAVAKEARAVRRALREERRIASPYGPQGEPWTKPMIDTPGRPVERD